MWGTNTRWGLQRLLGRRHRPFMTSQRVRGLELCALASLSEMRGEHKKDRITLFPVHWQIIATELWFHWITEHLLVKSVQKDLSWIKWLDFFFIFVLLLSWSKTNYPQSWTYNILLCNFIFYNWVHIVGYTLAHTAHLKNGNVNWNSVQQGRTLLQTRKQIRQKMKHNEADVRKIHKKNNSVHIGGRAAAAPSEVLEMCCLLSVLF